MFQERYTPQGQDVKSWCRDGVRASPLAGWLAAAYHEFIPHLEDLLEVCCHGLRLVSEAAVGADAHAVLACHGQDGRTIVLQDRLAAGIRGGTTRETQASTPVLVG